MRKMFGKEKEQNASLAQEKASTFSKEDLRLETAGMPTAQGASRNLDIDRKRSSSQSDPKEGARLHMQQANVMQSHKDISQESYPNDLIAAPEFPASQEPHEDAVVGGKPLYNLSKPVFKQIRKKAHYGFCYEENQPQDIDYDELKITSERSCYDPGSFQSPEQIKMDVSSAFYKSEMKLHTTTAELYREKLAQITQDQQAQLERKINEKSQQLRGQEAKPAVQEQKAPEEKARYSQVAVKIETRNLKMQRTDSSDDNLSEDASSSRSQTSEDLSAQSSESEDMEFEEMLVYSDGSDNEEFFEQIQKETRTNIQYIKNQVLKKNKENSRQNIKPQVTM